MLAVGQGSNAMTVYLTVALLTLSGTFLSKAETVFLQVECQWKPHQEQFPYLFSLDIFKKNTSLVHLSEGKPPLKLDSSGMVKTYSGILTTDIGLLNATLSLPCALVSEIECELFGMNNGAHDYRKHRFKPQLVFDVGPDNPKMIKNPEKETYAIGDVILLTCSTQVGTNTSKWRWTAPKRTTNHTTEFRPVPEEDYSVSTIYLSTNLFLSSFLVYIHFILLPTIFAILGEDRISFRKPDRRRWRALRSTISLVVGVTFFLWWAIVIECSTQVMLSYLIYAVIELMFIIFYTLTRFTANLSRCFEKRRQRYLYNARVATSYGAVMTPSICWAMIKSHGGTSILGLEIFFWIVSLLSWIGFVCVSKTREETYWEIVEKSES